MQPQQEGVNGEWKTSAVTAGDAGGVRTDPEADPEQPGVPEIFFHFHFSVLAAVRSRVWLQPWWVVRGVTREDLSYFTLESGTSL